MRTVFAVIPAAQSAALAVRAFLALPRDSNAKLVGMYVSPFAASYGFGANIILSSMINAQLDAIRTERTQTQLAFENACSSEGVDFTWRLERAAYYLVSPHAGESARAADLVIIPDDETSVVRYQIEEVVFTSGRPVLAIPANWAGETLGKRVLVAWDGGREATRAVFDALPLLTKADAVRIASVQGVHSDPVGGLALGDEVAATLARHGVRAECHTFQSTDEKVGDEIKKQFFDFGADMTVMGCYGHSRLRELILGGVSREMLKNIPFPVLLAN